MEALSDEVMESRRTLKSDDEPLFSDEVSVVWDGSSYRIVIPARAAEIHGIEKGDTVTVDVYENIIGVNNDA